MSPSLAQHSAHSPAGPSGIPTIHARAGQHYLYSDTPNGNRQWVHEGRISKALVEEFKARANNVVILPNTLSQLIEEKEQLAIEKQRLTNKEERRTRAFQEMQQEVQELREGSVRSRETMQLAWEKEKEELARQRDGLLRVLAEKDELIRQRDEEIRGWKTRFQSDTRVYKPGSNNLPHILETEAGTSITLPGPIPVIQVEPPSPSTDSEPYLASPECRIIYYDEEADGYLVGISDKLSRWMPEEDVPGHLLRLHKASRAVV